MHSDPHVHSARAYARGSARGTAVAGALAAGVTLFATAAGADGWGDVHAAATHYTNLTRAQSPADRRSDQAAAVNYTGGRYFALSGSDVVSVSLDARAEAYRRYRGLDSYALGGTASYRRKLGVGVTVPWVLASISAVRDDFRESVRDSHRVAFTAEAGHRVTPAFDFSVGVTIDRRYGKFDPKPEVPGYSARVFDLQGRGAYARASYAVDQKLLVAGRFAVRRGDVEVTSQRSTAVYLASDAIADDPAFEDYDLYAYRLPGTTYSTSVNASWAVSDNASLNLALVRNRTDSPYDLVYFDRAITLSFAYRYP